LANGMWELAKSKPYYHGHYLFKSLYWMNRWIDEQNEGNK
jgi:hypothetical protein